MGQDITRRPWVQPTPNVCNGQIVSPHELAKGGSRHFTIFFDYLCVDLTDLIEIMCINFADPLGIKCR